MIKKKYLSDLNKLAVAILFFYISSSSNTIVPVNVGVILDDLNSGSGKMFSNSIRMALCDFYASHAYHKTRLSLKTRDSKKSVVGAAAAALDLIQNEQVQFILGPTTSTQTSFVIDLGEQAHVPIISFSATSPTLASLGGSYFFQFAQNDSSQVKALSAVVKAFGWREVVPICIDTLHGRAFVPFLADALEEVGTGIPYLSVIPSSATDDQIEEELYKLMMMQTRVFIVHLTVDLCSRLFTKANEIGMMSEGYVWLTTSGITNRLTSMNSSVIYSMNGVIGVQTYIPETRKLDEFRLRWKKKFQTDYPDIIGAELDVFGLWAYDAAFSIAMATEQVIGTTSSVGFQKPNASNKIIRSFPVSPYGPILWAALSTTRFEGIAGGIILIDGQLQSSNFRIININGRGASTIGFWTPQNGLVSEMSSPNSTCHLGPVVWPGDSLSVPKGWEIPTKGKRLRIGVPVKFAFTEFVKVKIDTTTDVTGFSIDVFKAVVEMLPYALPYEFIPFRKPDGTEAGSYDDLCYQVYAGNYDAAVGDISITANRSLYVDFTMPYTESGVAMVVPVKDTNRRSAFSLLKPLAWDLWVTSGCFFIFIGFVVWVLEHRINEDFRGPPLYQIGTSFWFSFSTMVFAHREKVVSNLARFVVRFVVIIWCFIVLILTQSYTARLTSLLTVQQLQPTVTDVNLLLKNGENVGYQSGSFVLGILKKLGFRDEKLRTFENADQLNELFRNGTANNGIAAAFDETPYMKLFLATYSSKYTMVEPTFIADGFAFVFPKDSPLARDVSRAILNVNEGGEMQRIEDRWFKRHDSCQDTSNNIVSSTNSLSLESFWGLFLIAGVASSLALLIFLAMFLYEHKDIRLDSDSSVWRKVLVMLRIYDQKDHSSHTFKKSGLEFHPNFPQSPSSYSNDTEAHNVFAGQTTPSPEHGDFSPTNGQSTREIELAIEHP